MKYIAVLIVAVLLFFAYDRTRENIPEAEVLPDPVASFVEALPVAGVDSVPVLSKGGPDQGYWDIVWSVRTAALVQDSILVSFDEVRRIIQSWDMQGNHRWTWGTEGEGPGEFRDIRPGVTPEGHIWVWDGGIWRFTVFDTEGEIIDDFAARRLPEIVPGGAIAGGQAPCRWFGSQWAESETELLGAVPLMGAVVECLPAGQDTLVTTSDVPAGRWMINAEGERVPMQMSMERHQRKLIAADAPMAVPTARGFALPPVADDEPEFQLPLIHGNWADPTEVMWTTLAGETVVYEPDGTPIARLPAFEGEILNVQRQVVITAREVGDFPLIEVWRLETPLGTGAAR